MADRSGAKLWLILGAAVLGVSIKMGLWNGAVRWYHLRYFTTLSNILTGIYALWALARGRSRVSALFRGTALLGVLITGIIYRLLLGSTFGGFPLFSLEWLGNQLAHTAVPLLMLLDWLIFAPKGRFGPLAPLGVGPVPAGLFRGNYGGGRAWDVCAQFQHSLPIPLSVSGCVGPGLGPGGAECDSHCPGFFGPGERDRGCGPGDEKTN